MSAVTLETLRAEWDGWFDYMWFRWSGVDLSRPGRQSDYDADKRACDLAQNMYEIAASFEDEAEGLRAAMLYRLSDGAIDPRKGGEA
jgi:hypothetical protein